ncbi:MAG: aryl-sulfate sulfotransferase [Ignavibacteriaceae bacterium]
MDSIIITEINFRSERTIKSHSKFYWHHISKAYIICFIVLSSSIFAQKSATRPYQFISPVPNSKMILPETNIIIREGENIDEETLPDNSLNVFGSVSGKHQGSIVLSDDKKTIIFKPFSSFIRGETVYVEYSGGMRKVNGDELHPFNYKFEISETDPEDYSRSINEILEQETRSDFSISHKPINKSLFSPDEDLPEDFPTITISTYSDPSEGFLFISPFSSNDLGYLIITDNQGIPIFYRRSNSQKHGFTLQSNGLLTYFDLNTQCFYAMDSSYTVVDTFKTGNGYVTDIHELQILPNGHSLLMASDPQPTRLDTIVPGGNPNATVVGLIIQELDSRKDVVFQWRSWDHFSIFDATEDIHFDWFWIDYVHGNAIDLDYDGNLLVSCRHMDEITKINRQTGDIIWRLGGEKARNNDFQFINDPVTFSHQHDIRRLPNGNISLFDNGNLHSPQFSRALEYQIDEENHTVNLVWSFNYASSLFSFGMGNAQRLSNHSSIIGWGIRTGDSRTITEVNEDGTIAFELSLPNNVQNYRALRFNWRTNLFITEPDSIIFNSVRVGDSATTKISLVNNSANSIEINSFYNTNSAYSVLTKVPFVLPSYGNVPVQIMFKPVEDGYFKDVLHIRSDTETSRVAQLVVLTGRADSTISSVDNQTIVSAYRLEQNYPNPFNPVTTIQYQIPQAIRVTLIIYDVLGRYVETLVNEEKPAGTYKIKFNASQLPSGIYFYRIRAGNYSDVKKFLLLK